MRPRLRRLVRRFRWLTAGSSLVWIAAAWPRGWYGRSILALGLALVVPAAVIALLSRRVRAANEERRRPWWVAAWVLPTFDFVWASILLAPLAVVLLVPAVAIFSILGVLGTAGVEVGPLSRSALDVGLGAVVAVSGFGVMLGPRTLRVRRVEVVVPHWLPEHPEVRIAHLTDLHVGTGAPLSRALRWVRRTNALRPHVVALTGDYVVRGDAYFPELAEALRELRAEAIVAVLGNHDYDDPVASTELLESTGCRVLRNAGLPVRLEDGTRLWIGGVEDLLRGEPSIRASLAQRPDGLPTILLTHNPDIWPAVGSNGTAPLDPADGLLVLAGHVHGGQLAVPFAADRLNLGRLATRWAMGVFRSEAATLVVSAGLGTTGPSFRLGALPEIVLVTLIGGVGLQGPRPAA